MKKRKSNAGRPTKMTDLTLQKLREAFRMGCTDEEACLYASISPTTLYNYQNENPQFVEEKTIMKNHPKFRARRAVYNSLDDPKHAEWYLERKAKDEFSLRQELTGKDGESLGYTKEDLHALFGKAIIDEDKPETTGTE